MTACGPIAAYREHQIKMVSLVDALLVQKSYTASTTAIARRDRPPRLLSVTAQV